MDLLACLEAQGNTTPVVVMTAWGNVDLAVEAMRRGACDFVQKPWDNNRLLATIRKQAESERAQELNSRSPPTSSRSSSRANCAALRTLDYAGHCLPAREVGGDYYDFLEITDHSLGFVLGDVSGKGVPAALLMANLQACFRSQSPRRAAAARPTCWPRVNRHFFDSTAAERFATLVLRHLRRRARARIRYVNCAHCPPLLLRAVRRDRDARLHRHHARRLRSLELQGGARPNCAAATRCCSIPTASPKPAVEQRRRIRRRPPDARSSAPTSRCPPSALVQAIVDDVNEFSGAVPQRRRHRSRVRGI